MKKELSFFERILGFYNESRHRVVCIFGLKIKIRSKYLMLRNKMDEQERALAELQRSCNLHRSELSRCEKLHSESVFGLEQKISSLEQSVQLLDSVIATQTAELAIFRDMQMSREEQRNENVKLAVLELKKNIAAVKRAWETDSRILKNRADEQDELRVSLRKNFLRTNYLGEEYEGWPKNYRDRILKQYRTFDFQHRKTNRVIVYMTDETENAGLADRLRTMMTAYVLAAESKKDFFIYHDKGFMLDMYLEPNEIDWRIEKKDVSRGLNKSYPLFFLKKFLDIKHIKREVHVYQSSTSLDYGFLTESLKGKYTECTVFHKLFRFSPNVLQMVDRVMSEIGIRENGYVPVHFRFLNFFEQVEKYGSVESTDVERRNMIVNALATIEEIHREVQMPILLFSDSNSFLQIEYPDYVKIVPGVVGHISKHGDDRDIIMKTFLDFILISRGATVYSVIGENIYTAENAKEGGLQNGFARTAASIENKKFVRYHLASVAQC